MTLMHKRTLGALLFTVALCSAVSAGAEERLCDASATNCRTSLIALIISRTGALAGWMEPVWTHGANQTRAVEIGALAALTSVAALAARRHRAQPDA